MTVAQINYINIFLMLVAAAVAFYIPFELLLFSYAVLGPLHYLTEISWLHDRRYFTTGKYDYLLLGLVAVPLTVAILIRNDSILYLAPFLLALSFFSAVGMALIKDTKRKLVLGLVSVFCAAFVTSFKPYAVLFALFLPTLIHVYVFTGAFILFGALKSKSQSGYFSFIVFIATPLFFLLNSPSSEALTPTVYDSESFLPWQELAKALGALFGDSSDWGIVVTAVRVMAFAYTYHYLNWFSKTQVIRWHEISAQRMAAIIAAWGLAVGAYAVDYNFGFIALFFLSLLHVLLEFPLNHHSFVGIYQEIRSRVK